ncbi:DUF927 domain-containing protein [Moraxella nasicaprae]|uniref:DUF927 domain-containing protein n=1 Tax=Moraxella nasicaprae TaxID=2904122 RepID=A0ABY6F619_9GAMM|nr:DUF927 domain-containing protein [Moraxella nasicaprae]UXZ05547.1 DUF927 domain-containing protein [Moraxella nasicaprae]
MNRNDTITPAHTVQEVDTIDELIKTYTQASDEQINYPQLKELASNALLWIDDDINEHKTAGKVAMVLQNHKGQAVNLAILGNQPNQKPHLINHQHIGAGVLGLLACDTAYVFDELDLAYEMASQLQSKSDDYCVLIAFGKVAQVAKVFAQTKRLILPIYRHQADELQAKIGDIPHVQIHACLDPIQDTLAKLDGKDSDISPIKSLDFRYQGGYFTIKESKLHYAKYDSKTEQTHELFICNALYIDGQTRDNQGGNWGRLLRFSDNDGRVKTWAMPTALLMGDSREYLKILADMGLVINTSTKAKALLTAYIQFHPCTDKLLCVDKVGWHDTAYTLPHKTWGDGVILQASHSTHSYHTKGTLEQWQQYVSKPCINHDRLAFAICTAFAGTLLKPLGETNSIGFHFVGASSMGKSLALRLAVSVWGHREFVRTWNATSNGMESIASLHNDNFLALDELGQCDAKKIDGLIYMLGNGDGKTRMNKNLTARQPHQWRICYLSTGEITLDGVLKQAGKSIRAGQAVRFAHINADAGKGLGMFDTLAGATDGHSLAVQLDNHASQYHGTAGVAWLDYLTNHAYLPQLRGFIDEFIALYDGLSSQAMRVCQYFAIVAGAGELATMAGITGWGQRQALQAVKVCFDDWLNTYGKYGDMELYGLIERVITAIETHQYGRMTNLQQTVALNDSFADGKPNLLGYIDKGLYLFTSSGFSEIANPLNKVQAINILQKVDLTKANHRKKYKKQINGKPQLFYAIKEQILTFLDDEA